MADANALQGQLFLVLQIRELGIPCMLLLNSMHTTGPLGLSCAQRPVAWKRLLICRCAWSTP